jgi:hypothetical protein
MPAVFFITRPDVSIDPSVDDPGVRRCASAKAARNPSSTAGVTIRWT